MTLRQISKTVEDDLGAGRKVKKQQLEVGVRKTRKCGRKHKTSKQDDRMTMSSQIYLKTLDIQVKNGLHNLRNDVIFQQDFAPYHMAESVKVWLCKNNIMVLDWPGSSLSLNPIENLWAICKRN